ncbi:N-acyl homoserine lactonase family protein [Cognatilysobacter bugurensis]|uniref:MBL fold metallo-hydrolase n=1 Tax=Cognatilysobacter bugurensis TaxID=543356 RepID=A0A918T0Y1_9GAMM|nr:N-acyl homoserine lactonase family protein [Lysobacter bugurensis]GHA83199.1 MBL fold metallo-hydrolase [Lysobacter bugurensis]
MSIPQSVERTLRAAVLVACAGAALSAHAADAANVALARLDCGSQPEPVSVASFSDTMEHPDLKLPLTYSCYLVRHGDRYLLWDAGNALDGSARAPKVSLVDQLARIGVKPGDVDYVGVSHHHADHTGQLASFPGATLVIGQGDWDVMRASDPPAGMDAKDFAARRAPFKPWISGGKVETLTRDRHDVFGDGRVLMINLPGHTPGHHGLLVKLDKKGSVLLTGDVTHFHENYASNGVPTWNTNRADSLASLDRFKKLEANLDATVIIQHDPRDVEKLPVFPEFAE